MITHLFKKQTKAARVERLLARKKGASISDICKTTDWKPHSVRAFLSRLRNKGLILEREQSDVGPIYHIRLSAASKAGAQ